MITRDITTDSEIYYSEQKSKFIQTVSETELNDFILFFRTTKRYEVFYEKDVLCFSRSQLMAMFEDLESTASTFEKRYRFLERYFEFCAKILPDISFSDLDVYQSLRRNSIRDFDEFLYIINHSFRPDDLQTLDVIRKSCVILLYLGVYKSELTAISKDDYDETNGTLRIERWGEEKRLPIEFVNVLNICKRMNTYASSNPKHVNLSLKDLQQNNYLIRCDASRGNEQCPSFFVDKIFNGDLFDSVNKSLTPTRVIEAGLYHQLYSLEKNGQPFQINIFRTILTQYFNKPITKYQHYFQNYISWKKAFGLK